MGETRQEVNEQKQQKIETKTQMGRMLGTFCVMEGVGEGGLEKGAGLGGGGGGEGMQREI